MYFVTTDQMRDSTASYNNREMHMFIWEYIIQNSVHVIPICCIGNILLLFDHRFVLIPICLH